MNKKKKVVIGVIGTDVHIKGNKVIHKMLEDNNFEVINIGILSPQIDFIYAAIETNADAIIISSIHGKAEFDFIGTREKCNELGLNSILLYAGGNISKPNEDKSVTEKRYKDMGFDRVYPTGISFDITLNDLKKDLKVL